MECYWFNDKGLLQDADYIDTGHRCDFGKAEIVGNLEPGKTTTIQILGALNERNRVIEKYQLRKDALCLKDVSISDLGFEFKAEDFGFGRSLIKGVDALEGINGEHK